MKKILIIGIILIGSGFITAQNYIPYYNLINEAEYAIFQENYFLAVQNLEEAFELEKPHAKDAYLMAYCLDNIDPTSFRERIEGLLIYASENTGPTIYWMKIQPLSISIEKDFYSALERNEAACDSIMHPVIDTLDYFLGKDQEVRRVLVDSIDPYYGKESKEYEAYLLKMSFNDSIYQTQFLSFIKTQGYPGIKRSGSDVVGNILSHIHSSLFEEYRSILLAELKKGNIYPFSYGMMVDRINCYMNGVAFYRAYNIGTELCQPEKEDAITNRISIGMSPYFQGNRRHVKIENALWPID